MKVFNTLSGKKEEFLPGGDEVRMYVCGVTPYDDAHIGHAMSYIIFDVVRRYLKYRGYKVRYVQNITDIDDKIIDRANQLGIPTEELAGRFSDSFLADMDSLNIRPADEYPRATGEIAKIIEVIGGLVDSGHAYPAGGSVYFRVRSDADYGKLAHRSLGSMMAGARIEAGEEKEHPMDFVLWKASKPGEPSWDSPWGKGRPGWHIECSAMSLKYLGETLDIHGGGQDLIFPHHENEIAQSEGFTGVKPFVRYWMHNGLLQLGEEKMSKSLGNLITIKEALARSSADAVRLFILSSHYRSPLTYSEGALEAAERGAERLVRVISRDDPTGGRGKALDAEPYRRQFIEAMDDDFNTAQALGILFDLAGAINQAADAGTSFVIAQSVFSKLAGNVLGLKLGITVSPGTARAGLSTTGPAVVILGSKQPTKEAELRLTRLVAERTRCRQEKQWQRADEIRAKLAELGVILEDTPEGAKMVLRRTPEVQPLDSLLAQLGIAPDDTPGGTAGKPQP